jgi:(p)ppGpp synthase/HD superfamily hydrolase
MNDLIDKAMKFGEFAHTGQLDDGGNDYFKTHCVQVYEIVKIVQPEDYALQAAALLHDTLEDTKVTYDELCEAFGKDIADLVNEVTHERRVDDKGWYFPRLCTIRGIILKFSDRTSNLSRMEDAWNEKRIKKYIEKSTFWKTEDDSDHYEV